MKWVQGFEEDRFQVFEEDDLLGKFYLDGITLAQRGSQQVEVTIGYDANDFLNISAQDKSTNKVFQIMLD